MQRSHAISKQKNKTIYANMNFGILNELDFLILWLEKYREDFLYITFIDKKSYELIIHQLKTLAYIIPRIILDIRNSIHY